VVVNVACFPYAVGSFIGWSLPSPRLASEPHYLQSLIRRHLLGNHHKVTLHLYPDTTLKEQLDTAETEKLASHWQSLKAKDVEELAKENEALLARQEAVDSPENLARIPCLKVSFLSVAQRGYCRLVTHGLCGVLVS
jgi:Zn-dependent M16 (insulinase) family peptidase